MNKSKDPFEAAYEEQEETPPQSPIAAAADDLLLIPSQHPLLISAEDDDFGSNNAAGGVAADSFTSSAAPKNKEKIIKEEDDDDEEDDMDVEFSKFSSGSDPQKIVQLAILSKFTEGQMSRYESFRRSALQRSNIRRLLVSATGSQKISLPMTIVVCGIAKMFVGELIETARIAMTERKESGPIRPCHIREAYRRLKLEGKVPKRSVSRLFR